MEDEIDTQNADHLYQEDKEMAYIPRMEENHNGHAQLVQTIKMLNNVIRGRYNEEEDQEMGELDEDEHRMIVEFMLQMAGVLLTTYLPSGYQVIYDEFEYDIKDDMDAVKTRSTSERELGLPSREYTADRGIQIVNVPIHDPNHYDLEWSSVGSTDELTLRAKTNIRPFTYEEVQNAIVHTLKLEIKAWLAYTTPSIQKSKYGAFYYTYIPRRCHNEGSKMNYMDSLPEDNEYISDYVNKFLQ